MSSTLSSSNLVVSSSSAASSTSSVSSTATSTQSSVVTSLSSSTPTPSATSSTSATPTKSSCTSPTPISCFTITGHGQSIVEGQPLGVRSYYTSPYYGLQFRSLTYAPGTFGIWPGGYVSVVSADNKGWYMSSRAGAEGIQEGTPDWLMFVPSGVSGWSKNVCTIDSSTKRLSCCNGRLCDFTIADSNNGSPSYGNYGKGLPITATYDLVTCPSMC